jgi:spore maturation protein CgeB
MRAPLRSTILYPAWRAFRERGQARAFTRLLDEGLLAAGEPYSEALLRRRLASNAAGRRPLHHRPRVVVFGTSEWEASGLWQSLGDMAEVTFFEYRAPYARPELYNDEYRNRLAQRFLEFLDARDEPATDCVFFYASAEHIDLALLDELHGRRMWTVVLALDDKHQFSRPADPATGIALQRRLASRCDLYWTTWRLGAELVLADGGTPWYAPEAADPRVHRPLARELDLDVVFIGQAYGGRGRLVKYLRRRGFRVAAHGAGWPGGPVTTEESIELYSRARVVLGFGGVGHMDRVKHLKGRDFEVPMCGALYLTNYNPELADHFRIGSEILCHGSAEECAELVHWAGRYPGDAAAVRRAARQRCLEEHTWTARFAALFTHLESAGRDAELSGARP